METYEWISEIGLIKRITIYPRTICPDENGESQYYGTLIETLSLKKVNLK